jgi:diguanylate cyclase (GGDEF)-like protein/PAS domain S-box-containing protein/putative nucleotidyltransferase with HDIG domain
MERTTALLSLNDITLIKPNLDFLTMGVVIALLLFSLGLLVGSQRKPNWKERVYRIKKFPVGMANGRLGIGAYIKEIIKKREREKKQEKILHRHRILAQVLIQSFQSKQEQLNYVLQEALKLTESQYGYIYLYDAEKQEFTLNSWTGSVLKDCNITEKVNIYQLEKIGLWGEVIRQKKAIVINDFEQPNQLKKGYPKGHVALKKYMSIPVIIDKKIVAVVGFANKHSDYDYSDVYGMTLLMSGVWNAVERREAQEKLTFERNKYLQTLISIGDGVMVVDKKGQVEVLNHVAEKLTGWSNTEAFGRHYKDIFVLSHEQQGRTINDPIAEVFATDSTQELGNHAVLTSKNGTKYYLEDSAAPIKDDNNTTVGVVLVFRDVTDKKAQRKKIEYLSFHDSLTGLYNRRFFEEEMNRLDTERNLPLSIIMGDVNGLKLTNDIFGHTFGDILLEKVGEVLRRVCRADDIIARWGGDEFVLLLPKTSLAEAEQIIERIKAEFSQEQVKAIKGSISMGAAAKYSRNDRLMEALESAEEKMYLVKTLEHNEVGSSVVDTIITTLHEHSTWEKAHSIHVSELCQELGRALKLSQVDIRKLKEAGYLHDIGKVVLDPKKLNKNFNLSDQGWNEIKKHSIVGYRILNSFDDKVDLAESVLAHHEKWDGSGYPKGLKGEEIPLLARIISIVESYDRMLHSGSEEAMSKTEAIRVIKENGGTWFDPHLTELFAQLMETNFDESKLGL